MITEQQRNDWLAALRSGKYHQGRHQLRNCVNPPRFCCLGVLADVINPGVWDAHAWRPPLQLRRYVVDLPEDLVAGPIQSHLQHMNDRWDGASFTEIANYIEHNVPFLSANGRNVVVPLGKGQGTTLRPLEG
jgi:hypothetical protein